MNIDIITQPFQSDIYGFGSVAVHKDYAATAFRLSGKMWDIIKNSRIKNKGKNIWVYGAADHVFAGVELENPTEESNASGLEKMTISIEKYAYYKHKGSYQLLKQAGQNMTRELTRQGFETRLPYIEIYGHWTNEESKLETELIMSLQ